jgi:hypothetical protein
MIGASVAVILLVHYFRGPDRASYLAKNERILSGLARPPGAHETARQILKDEEQLFGEQLSHTVGYTTYVTYTVPPRTTQEDVVRFYTQRLRNWHRTSWTVDRTLFACFDRKRAIVSIQPEGMHPLGSLRKTYGLAANYQGGSCD